MKQAKAGFTLMEILIAAGSFALLSLMFASYAIYLTKFQSDQALRRVAEEILMDTHRLVYNNTAWENTVNDADNINLACLRNDGSVDESTNTGCSSAPGGTNIQLSLTADPSQAIFLRNANSNAVGGQGDLFYDPYNLKGLAVGTPGFSTQGVRCNLFSSVTPTDRCPIFMRLHWSPQCEVARGCKYPLIRIGAFMEFASASGSKRYMFGQPLHRLLMFRNPSGSAKRSSVVFRQNVPSGLESGPCRPTAALYRSRTFYSKIDMGTPIGLGGDSFIRFRLDAGRYECEFSAAAFGVGTHYSFISRDRTYPPVAAPLVMGTLERAGTSGWVGNSVSVGFGEFIVDVPTDNIYLSTYCQQESTVAGPSPTSLWSSGRPASTGEDEVYATVRCTRLD